MLRHEGCHLKNITSTSRFLMLVFCSFRVFIVLFLAIYNEHLGQSNPFPRHRHSSIFLTFCICVIFLARGHPSRVREVVQQCRNLSVFHNFYVQSSNITFFTGDFHHAHTEIHLFCVMYRAKANLLISYSFITRIPAYISKEKVPESCTRVPMRMHREFGGAVVWLGSW